MGMFEHVGRPQYTTYFKVVSGLLSDDGIALIHTIGHTGPPLFANPWIARYIFPGGYAPSMSEVTRAIDKVGLCINDVEVLRTHYAETLRHWHDRFSRGADRVSAMFDERFVRMWKYYLISMERSFREGKMVVHQYQLSKKNDVLPITRDYLYGDALVPERSRRAAQ